MCPASHFFENMAAAWEQRQFRPQARQQLIFAGGVTAGKIVGRRRCRPSRIVYFSYRGRVLMFWLIFITLMLPLEVRIVPTYAVAANALRPFQSILDFAGITG